MLNHRSLRKTLLSLCQYLLASLNRKLGMAFVVIVWATNKECVPLFVASGKWSEVLWCGWSLLTLLCCITLCQTKTCIVSSVQLITIRLGLCETCLLSEAGYRITQTVFPDPCRRELSLWTFPTLVLGSHRPYSSVIRGLHGSWVAWSLPKKPKELEELFVGFHSWLSFSFLHVE